MCTRAHQVENAESALGHENLANPHVLLCLAEQDRQHRQHSLALLRHVILSCEPLSKVSPLVCKLHRDMTGDGCWSSQEVIGGRTSSQANAGYAAPQGPTNIMSA